MTCLAAVLLTTLVSPGPPSGDPWPGAREVLIQRCIRCHGGEHRKSGLSFADHAHMAEGGDRGDPINRGDLSASRLLSAVRYENPSLAMPPDSRLPAEEIAAIEQWVLAGAPWPDDATAPLADPTRHQRHGSEGQQEDRDGSWWAYQPLRTEPVPQATTPLWASHPIDRFIDARRSDAGLGVPDQADAVALIRRASFDLIGLPPTPAQVIAFVDHWESDQNAAWSTLIDELLASPHHGEHWGRHWLDLVRFAESNGYERDATKANMWRYRDWVIRAINSDLPYDQFLHYQLAGDLLAEHAQDDALDPLLATGYFRLQTWDDEPADRTQARADEIADIVDTTGQVFMATTMGCARCHDHKADPISQRDYYAMTAVFNNVAGYGEFPDPPLHNGATRLLADPPTHDQLSISEKQRLLEHCNESLQPAIGLLHRRNHRSPPPQTLVASASTGEPAQWTYLQATPPAGWMTPAFDDSAWLRGAGGFGQEGTPGALVSTSWSTPEIALRTRFALTEIPEGITLQLHHDDDVEVYLNGQHVLSRTGYQVDYAWHQLDDAAVDHLVVGSNVLAVRCRQGAGGQYIDAGLKTGWINSAHAQIQHLRRNTHLLPQPLRGDVTSRLAQIDRLEAAPVADPYPAQVVIERNGSPPPQHVLLRGSAHAPGERVDPAPPSVLASGEALDWMTLSSGMERRDAFARWLIGEGAFLTARVAANRLWQFHFGRGLCPSPGDFGRLGLRPTHPELLDHLAQKLIDESWSLKAMHRYIMSSEAYRMSSQSSETAASIDPNNALYWRFDPRRLTAEQFRDAVLQVSGLLDRELFGPSVHPPMQAEALESSSRPDQAWPTATVEETDRRSIYIFSKRSLRMPLMEALDQPDPDLPCPERFPTNVPTQALLLLNSDFMHRAAGTLAARYADAPEQITPILRDVLGRTPTSEEVERSRNLVTSLESHDQLTHEEALSVLALSTLNLNEFSWID